MSAEPVSAFGALLKRYRLARCSSVTVWRAAQALPSGARAHAGGAGRARGCERARDQRPGARNQPGAAPRYAGPAGAGAERLFEESLALCRELGDHAGITRAIMGLATLLRQRREPGRAEELLEEGLMRARTFGTDWAVANVLISLGHVAREQGDNRRAERLYRESLVAQAKLGNLVYVALSLEGLAAVASERGSAERAITLCAAASRLRDEAQAPLPPAERAVIERTLASARSYGAARR